MNILQVLLMAAEGGKPNPMGNLLFFVAMIAVMYFFMLRPQMKRQKEQKEFGNSTNVGDNIVTTAGIHGKIVKINEDGTMALEIDRNTVIKIDKSAVSMEMTTALRKRSSGEVKS